MAEWRTAAAIAERLGIAQTAVDKALSITGMRTASRYHARGEGADREYSPGAQGHIRVELQASGKLNKARLRKRQAEREAKIATQHEAESAIVRAMRISEPTQSAARLGVTLPEYQRRWMDDGDRVTLAQARRWQDYGGVMVTRPEPLMFVGPLPAEPPARPRGRRGYAILDDAAFEPTVREGGPVNRGLFKTTACGPSLVGSDHPDDTGPELSPAYAPPEPAPAEPSRQRRGPPIGDRLARRLRRGRPR